MALAVLSLLCTFENSSDCIITSFDSDSFPEQLKGFLIKLRFPANTPIATVCSVAPRTGVHAFVFLQKFSRFRRSILATFCGSTVRRSIYGKIL